MKKGIYKLLYILLLILPILFPIYSVDSAPSVDFKVTNVFWGTPPNNVISVSPGSVNVPLTIIIQNNSNNTLRGVLGILDLVYPFVDYVTESNQSRANGQPIEVGDVFNQTGDILPSGSFSLTFYLNIKDDAVKGRYQMNLTLYYNVKVGDVFVAGEPVTLEIEAVLPNRAPEIYSLIPSSTNVVMNVNETLTFSIKARDPDNDTILIDWFFDGENIDSGENYTLIANESIVGTHQLRVDVSDGNLTVSNTWFITINLSPDKNISVSSHFLYGGYINNIRVRIGNSVWFGTVNIAFNIPQPLALLNDYMYAIKNVTPHDILSFDLTIYAPQTLIGQTIQSTIDLNYKDSYGNVYTDTIILSFIIRGRIIIRVYEITVSPYPAKPGEKVTISGTILNAGNVKALFANLTLIESDVVSPEFLNYLYIGDLDANSPVPFTFSMYVKNDAENGTYLVSFKLVYSDDLYEENFVTFSVPIKVITIESSNQQTEESEETLSVQDIIIIASTIIAVVLAAVIYVRRRA